MGNLIWSFQILLDSKAKNINNLTYETLSCFVQLYDNPVARLMMLRVDTWDELHIGSRKMITSHKPEARYDA